MHKEPEIFIGHILSCINDILLYTEGMSIESFMSNKMVQDAVIRNFEVMGEASKNISADFRNQQSEIPWRQIAGLRDVLIHNYLKVDLEAVWTTVTDHLPSLKLKLEKL